MLTRESGKRLTMLLGMMAGMVSTAWSQLTPPSTWIQPTLNVQALATSNAELAKGSNQTGKKELVLSVTPGIGFQIKGAQSELLGHFQLEALRYVRATQSDRILPSGDARLKLEAVKDAVGFEASLTAAQVRADVTAQQAGQGNTANSYTDTTLHVAPYLRSRFDASTQAEVRLDRGLLKTTQNATTLTNPNGNEARRDAAMSDDVARVSRTPSPVGYQLEWRHRSERYQGDADPALEQREGRATVLLAPDPDVTLGLTFLHATDELKQRAFNDNALGYQIQWRPTERSQFQASTEERTYGRNWLVDLQHRWRSVTVGLNAERTATTYAREAGRPAVGVQPLTPPSAPTGAGTATDGLQPFDTGAQLRQAIQGRMIVMGRRNQLNVAAGLVKSSPLIIGSDGDLEAGPLRSRETYVDTQLTHQLTPDNSLTGGLRWGRVRALQAQTGEAVVSRDFVMRAAFNTKLTPNTTATMGLKRQITHNTPITSANETAGYVGLGHRF